MKIENLDRVKELVSEIESCKSHLVHMENAKKHNINFGSKFPRIVLSVGTYSVTTEAMNAAIICEEQMTEARLKELEKEFEEL